jgi:hypothetical protein
VSLNRNAFSASEFPTIELAIRPAFSLNRQRDLEKSERTLRVLYRGSACHSAIPPAFLGFMVSWFVSSGEFQEFFCPIYGKL